MREEATIEFLGSVWFGLEFGVDQGRLDAGFASEALIRVDSSPVWRTLRARLRLEKGEDACEDAQEAVKLAPRTRKSVFLVGIWPTSCRNLCSRCPWRGPIFTLIQIEVYVGITQRYILKYCPKGFARPVQMVRCW